MWNTIQEWLNALPVSEEIIKSALMIVAVIAGRSILLSAHFRSHPDLSIENKRRSLVVSRNITMLLLLFGLAMIWAAQIQTLALSMFAVAAAIVVATKELIMCLSGSILRSVTKQYSIGDYIEINGLRGRVVDINMLNTADDANRPQSVDWPAFRQNALVSQQPASEPPRAPRQYFGRLCDSYGGNPPCRFIWIRTKSSAV